MPKRAAFEPRETAGRTSKWVVNLPASHSTSGKRERHFFATKEAAGTFCDQAKIRIKNYGTQAALLTPANAEQALQAFEKLKPFGVPLNAVVEDWIARHRAAEASISFEKLLEDFALSGRHNRKRSNAYRQSILQVRNRLDSLHGRQVSQITPAQIDAALMGMKPSVRNYTLRILTCAFNLAVAREHLKESPVKKVEHFAAEAGEIRIYTPSEVAKILRTAEEQDESLIPFLAISFFAGVRWSEVLRMVWEYIEMDEQYIRLPKQITKTRQGRHIPIEENLLQWLMPVARKSGPIVPFTPNVLRRQERTLRCSHGVPAIKHGPRHSYGSYWLAMHENIDRLMLSMGHTDFETTREHYAKAVTKKAAQAYWRIIPASTRAQNVVSIPVAA